MTRSTHIKLRQLAVITLAWIIVGVFMAAYDHLVLLTKNSQGISPGYSFGLALSMNVVSALIGAALGGSFLVFYINVKYQDKPYGYTLLAVAVSFVLIIALIVMVIGFMSVCVRTGRFFTDPAALHDFKIFLFDSTRAKNIMTWALVVSFTQFFLQISNKFGQHGLGHILRGKYNTPKAENRIIMFLDLNSSTTIAEKIGDEKYHQLLRDFFADITEPIVNNNGEIYQYVGDEVVVVWNYADGIADNRCIRCFFHIKASIQRNAGRYLQRYGFVPDFKAGLHCGQVVAGEVGILKREITYSGDVLNTTARMLGYCKEAGAEVITSATLLHALDIDKQYRVRDIGLMKLRGKEKEVSLHEVCINDGVTISLNMMNQLPWPALCVYRRQA